MALSQKTPPKMSQMVSNKARFWFWRVAVALLLGLVFSAYLNPHLVVDLAGRVWSCF